MYSVIMEWLSLTLNRGFLRNRLLSFQMIKHKELSMTMKPFKTNRTLLIDPSDRLPSWVSGRRGIFKIRVIIALINSYQVMCIINSICNPKHWHSKYSFGNRIISYFCFIMILLSNKLRIVTPILILSGCHFFRR